MPRIFPEAPVYACLCADTLWAWKGRERGAHGELAGRVVVAQCDGGVSGYYCGVVSTCCVGRAELKFEVCTVEYAIWMPVGALV